MITCHTCKETKNDEAFALDSSTKTGRKVMCRTCRAAYDKSRGPARGKVKKEAKARKTKNYRIRHPEKQRAVRAVQYAIIHGTLKPIPCEMCGKKETQAHHDDYSKPLVVRWLCQKHHTEVHAQQARTPSPALIPGLERTVKALGSNPICLRCGNTTDPWTCKIIPGDGAICLDCCRKENTEIERMK